MGCRVVCPDPIRTRSINKRTRIELPAPSTTKKIDSASNRFPSCSRTHPPRSNVQSSGEDVGEPFSTLETRDDGIVDEVRCQRKTASPRTCINSCLSWMVSWLRETGESNATNASHSKRIGKQIPEEARAAENLTQTQSDLDGGCRGSSFRGGSVANEAALNHFC